MNIPNSKKHYKNTVTLKGKYLVGYYIGIDEHVEEAYNKMLNKIDELNLTMGDYVYEEYVFDSVIKNNENEYITKIMIEVI